MFYTPVTAPTAALAAEHKIFSLLIFKIQFGPSFPDQGLTRGAVSTEWF